MSYDGLVSGYRNWVCLRRFGLLVECSRTLGMCHFANYHGIIELGTVYIFRY